MESTMEELVPCMRGWRSYFGSCETPDVLIYLTRWARLELGVRPRLASNTPGSGLGPWYLAKAKALAAGLSNAHFKSLGLPSLVEEMPT